MTEALQLNIADISEFKRALFHMNPQQIAEVISAVDAMKPELKKRLEIRSALENHALRHGSTLKALQLTKSTVKAIPAQ